MGFFLTNPSEIIGCEIIPNATQSHSAKYNALFRLLLIITIIMFILEWKYTLLFFTIATATLIFSYYSNEEFKKENFNYIDKMPMPSHQSQNNEHLTPLERVKKFNATQGYPNFNKPLYIPQKMYDLDVVGGFNPLNVFGKLNYEPVRQIYPESKDLPDVPDPRLKRKPVQYLESNNDNNNIIQSQGVLSRDELRQLFKNSDRITVNRDIEPANMPNTNNFDIPRTTRTVVVKKYDCKSCGNQYASNEKWCPQCGMGSTMTEGDTPQLQRVKTLPEWNNQHYKAAKGVMNVNKKENFNVIGGYDMDNTTYIGDIDNDYGYNEFNPELNYKPFTDGGLSSDPYDNGKIINRTNPHMFYRKGNLQEENYPQTHEFDDFADEGLYVFNRLDPQAIRDQGLDPARLEEMPKRNQFSKRISRFEAPTHTTPIDQIDNNPEIDMYQLGYNGMKDLAGNIKYQVAEATYQYPNFSKSKVDHNLYLNPMYQVMPESRRIKTLEEARVCAESQWMNDSLNQRTDIMESYLDKFSARRQQQRFAPHSAARGVTGFTGR